MFVENFEKPKVADIYKKLPTIFKVKDNEKKNTIKLEFDQVAFAHLLLQLNRNQNLFDFQIIPSYLPKIFEIPERRKDISDWFTEGVKNFKQSENEKKYEIDYWIGITSEKLKDNKFFVKMKLMDQRI